MRIRRFSALAAALLTAVVGVGTSSAVVSPAQAGDYRYSNTISCGSLSPIRTAGVVLRGNYTADLGWSGYTFTWKDSRSELYFNACGTAAPYGQYAATAGYQKLRTEYRVSSVKVTGCDASAKVNYGRDKDGNNIGVETGVSCSLGSEVKKHVITTSSSNRPARLVHGGTIEMSGTYCNYAQLAGLGTVHAPNYNFTYAPVQRVRKVTAC
ncbi:hypothetical protein [Nocardioides perillae]|uniref:Tat pathway signal sequence domain protein n=1 Tax=Nocardioides perillae TaxID=1119534 RepID=A0A7Y9UV30_9ACTN|nr:hypothetical protein [Nocardioides perillae]NYG55050.1 hypothetical protein [Nocardioides perillae]